MELPFGISMVGVVGLEPTRLYSQRILSPVRLPIPPHPHKITRHDFSLDQIKRSNC